MKIKTAELTGKPLDWALVVALNARDVSMRDGAALDREGLEVCATIGNDVYAPFMHTDPTLCMELIKKYRANIDHTEHAPQVAVSIWYAVDDSADPDFDSVSAVGQTVEQAVARCVVQMRLGDEVSVPDELCGVLV